VEVAPGIHRLGEELVNAYLVEERGSFTLVDAGTPAYWPGLHTTLAGLGRSIEDVKAVVLTHGHDDHVGFAERARLAGVPVRIHADDVALATGAVANKVHVVGPYRLGPLVRFLWFFARHGAFRTPRLGEATPFDDGATLDVPGTPTAIHVPGHTRGSVALHMPSIDALFVGDSLNTLAVTNGRTGPRLSPFNDDRAQALASLRRLETVEAAHVLPGHGAPWHLGVRAAVEAVRATEVERNLR
jgi:glyoxylase-like metal-dependent hydrolase (beta-lactamase superfamily II)